MSSWLSRLLSSRTLARRPAQRARLGLETLEDRTTPTVSFNPATGVLLIQADPSSTYESVNITPAGARSDGSTGVNVFSSLNNYQTQTFGDAAHAVKKILLDLKNGQDSDNVQIASLTATDIAVGAGNGSNFIQVGDAQSISIIAGSGYNNIQIGSGSAPNAFDGHDESVFLGVLYSADTTAGTISFGFGSFVGNAQSNYVRTGDLAGATALVYVVGAGFGANNINTGNGNDQIQISGDGSNYVNVGNGNDSIQISGNGSNTVFAGNGNTNIGIDGNGSNYIHAGNGINVIEVDGSGNSTIFAGSNPNDKVIFMGAVNYSYVNVASGAQVTVNGTQVSTTGFYPSVYVQFT